MFSQYSSWIVPRSVAVGIASSLVIAIAGIPLMVQAAEKEVVATTNAHGVSSVSLSGSDYVVAEQDGAQLLVQRDVSSSGGISIKGTGWLASDGSPSIVTIKLDYRLADGTSGTYQRQGSDVVAHPVNGNLEPTIWLLHKANEDGAIDLTIDAPKDMDTGQRLVVKAASGLTGEPDVQRSITSSPLTVGGVPWVDEDGEKTTCKPTTSTPQYSVASEPNSDGTLTISGTGWCNATDGGSTIAIKIDEGKYQRLTTSINDNRTIWEIIDAEPTTGDWTLNLILPDGSTSGPNGSDPAFTVGEHKLRFLTGSLKEGDPIRTVPARGSTDTSFVVGEYRPSGAPDPVDYNTDLMDSTQGGVSVKYKQSASEVTVSVAGGKEGQWVFFTTYMQDTSPRWPWTQWYQLNAKGEVTLSTKNVSIPSGNLKFVVQSGAQGNVGALIGWDEVTVRTADSADATDSDEEASDSGMAGALGGLESAITTLGTYLGTTTSATQSTTDNDDEEVVVTIGGETVTVAGGTAASTSMSSTSSASSVPRVSAVATTPQIVRSATVDSTKPQPTATPNAPVSAARDLVTANAGPVAGTVDGKKLDITLSESTPGEWVYLYLYSPDAEPKGLGWIQVSDSKQVGVDIDGLGAGLHKIAVVAESAQLIGWTGASVGADGDAEGTEVSDGSSLSNVPLVAASTPLVGATDWALIIGSLAVVELATIGMIIRRKRTTQS